MAYQQEWDEEDEQQQQGGQGQSGNEQVLSSGSTELGGGQQSQQAPAGQGKPTSSGSWTNLMDYVKANEGNDAQMGEKVKGGIENRAGTAQASAGQYKNNADTQIAAGTVTDQGIINEIGTNAAGVAKDSGKRAQFEKQWEAYYGGPKDTTALEGYQDTDQQYKKVDERAQNAQSHTGRQDLLRDEYNRPNYTRGENTLDSFILGAGDQGRQVLTDINQQYSNYSDNWKSLLNDVGASMTNAENVTNQTRENTRGAVNTNIDSLDTRFDDYATQVAAQNKKRDDDFAWLTKQLAAGKNYSNAGLDANVANFLRSQGLSPAALVAAAGDRKLGDLTSADDVANYQALLDLGKREAGKHQDFSTSGVNEGQYFSMNNDLYGAGKQAYQQKQAIDARLNKAQKARQAEFKKIDNLLSYIEQGKPLTGQQDKQLKSVLKDLEININDYNAVKRVYGPEALRGFFTQGAKLKAEDVMNKNDFSTWGSLVGKLSGAGFKPGIGTSDSHNEGNAYGFNMNQFEKMLHSANEQLPELARKNGWTIEEVKDSTRRR